MGSTSDLNVLLSQRVRAINNFTYFYPEGRTVEVRRKPSEDFLFDEVILRQAGPPNQSHVMFAKLVATVQKHLSKTPSPIGIGNLLGPSVKEHFEAREAALARLERMANDVLVEMEEARKRRELELHEKENTLEERYRRKEEELEVATKRKTEELDHRSAELDTRAKELDDRAAKHARRQHYKDIKLKFESWSKTFDVTPGTKRLRYNVYGFTIILMLLFLLPAGWFLYQTVTTVDSVQVVQVLLKQMSFTALFVATAYFFIRWNNQWFQRHANEEFRLKRMELDIDRASWFVEMAFEWKDEKGEEIPDELIERLTQGLFSYAGDDHAVEPAESLAHALLGAARFKVKLPGDIEAEYDRKGVDRLMREERKRIKRGKATSSPAAPSDGAK